MMSETFTITRDGAAVVTGLAESEVLHWFHQHTSGSADWAQEYEGYSVERDPFDQRDCLRCHGTGWFRSGGQHGVLQQCNRHYYGYDDDGRNVWGD